VGATLGAKSKSLRVRKQEPSVVRALFPSPVRFTSNVLECVILALVLGNCAGVAGMRGLEAGGSILNVDFSTGNTPPISPYPPSLQCLSVSHIEWEGLEKGLEAGGSILNVDCSTGNTPPISLYPPWLVSIEPIKPKLLPDWRLLAGIAKQLMLFSLCGVPWGVVVFLGPYL
jgi:hypothetical protein